MIIGKKQNRLKRKRWSFFGVVICLFVIGAPLAAELADGVLTGIFSGTAFVFDFSYSQCMKELLTDKNKQHLLLLMYILVGCFMISTFYRVSPSYKHADVMEPARGIKIPVPAGNGEYGTARFLSNRELQEIFPMVEAKDTTVIKGLQENTGIIVNYEKYKGKEQIYYLAHPVNTIVLGATRSGKSRRLLMNSVWLGILAGINQFIIDVKGEIYAFTSPFAKANDYDVRTLDFRYPEKSMHFNNLHEIVKLLKEHKISEAVDKAWDIVSVLVGEPKGERIWTDGQCATIAAVILLVANDAPEECKNLTNVYYFLAFMCESDPQTGEAPINEYLEKLPYSHPARAAFQIAKIAPFKTRGSFFTSALATLRLYSAWNVADITGTSDYSFENSDEKKVIYYLILPDEKTTYHPIGAIFIKQLYESLVAQAFKKGGKLDRRFVLRCDEIGNFPVIPALGTMLSAGAGRNIFFELYIQDEQQIEKYKDDFRNIRTNCQLTIGLKVTDEQTTKRLSHSLGNYTIQTSAASTSVSDGRGMSANASYSSNVNLTGRPLLFPDEISQIENPEALLLYGGVKAIVNLPDLSEYYANEALGLGNEDFNRKLFLERMEARKTHTIGEPRLWGIWNLEKRKGKKENEQEKRVSFL